MPYLMLLNARGVPEREWTLKQDVTRVGRGQKMDVQVDDPALSRLHFAIVYSSGKYLLEDLGSSGGTRVNGKRVEREALSAGDLIRAGSTEFYFDVGMDTVVMNDELLEQKDSVVGGVLQSIRLSGKKPKETE